MLTAVRVSLVVLVLALTASPLFAQKSAIG